MKNAVSPLRYPGGKSWLTPFVTEWLKSLGPVDHFVEPFCGGASIGLYVGLNKLVKHVYLADIDPDIANFWRVVCNLTLNKPLQDKISSFVMTEENVNRLLDEKLNPAYHNFVVNAFITLIKNRVNYGGILHNSARRIKGGDGKGIASRWYPDTLINRLDAIHNRQVNSYGLQFIHKEFARGEGAIEYMQSWQQPNTVFFIDPPYSMGNKKAGNKLYNHSQIDHNLLFATVANLEYPFLMTYDNDPHVVNLASEHGLSVEKVPMKTNHHTKTYELIIRGKHG